MSVSRSTFHLLYLVAVSTGHLWAEHRNALGGALNGAAAIIGATSGIVQSAAQATTDRYVAGVQADLQRYQTDVAAANSLALAEIGAATSMAQAQMAFEANIYNQNSVTQRLGMQLDAQTNAMYLADQAAREERMFEYWLAQQKIESERRLYEAQLKQKQVEAEIQLMIAGLGAGGGSGLTVSPSEQVAADQSNNSFATAESTEPPNTVRQRLIASVDVPAAGPTRAASPSPRTLSVSDRGMTGASHIATVLAYQPLQAGSDAPARAAR